MRAAQHAPGSPKSFLEYLQGLAEIIERGAGVIVERPGVIPSHHERERMTLAENTLRYGNIFSQE